MTNCPHCGAPLSPSDETYCKTCGQAVHTGPAAGGAPAAEDDILNLIAKAQAGVAAQKEGEHVTAAPAEGATHSAPEKAAAAESAAAFAGRSLSPQPAQAPGAGAPAQQSVPLPPQAPAAGSAAPGGLFGDATPAAAPQPAPQAPGTDLFATGGAPAPQNLFEQSMPAQGGADLFGQQAPSQDLFAAGGAPAPQNLFDQPAQGGADLFGQQAPSQNLFAAGGAPAPQNLFDQPAPVQQQAPPPQQQQRYSGSNAPRQQQAPRQPQAGGQQPMAPTQGYAPQPMAGGQQFAPQNTAPFGGPPPAGGPNLFGEPTGGFAPQQRQPQRYAPPPVPLPQPEPRKKGGSTALKVVISLFIFIILTAGVTLGMLYFINRPAKVIDDFAAAVTAADTGKLRTLTVLDGVESTAEGWQAFCDAFEQEEDLNVLKSQLLSLSSQPQGSTGQDYPAVTIEEQDFFLFIKKYKIRISAVEMLAPGASEGTVAELNGVNHTGTLSANGMVYSALMPGRYTCRLIPSGVDASTVSAITVTMFGTDGPNAIDGNLLRTTITIENCLSDDAIIYVNDAPVQERPVNGVVTLPSVALGSTIRISLTKDGAPLEATVVFSDPAATTLRFDNYTAPANPPPSSSASQEPDVPAPEISVDEINALMGTFYSSYLDCINAQSMDPLQVATDRCKTAVEARVKSDVNATRLFQFTSVSCDAESLRTRVVDGVHVVEFNMTFNYNHKPRDSGSYTAGTNNQSVQLVYQNGEWKVNYFDFVDDDDFNNHKVNDF